MTDTRTILAKLKDKRVQLYRGPGYWYFVFDAIEAHSVYETLSVYTMRLNDMPLEQWVAYGRQCIAQGEAEIEARADH